MKSASHTADHIFAQIVTAIMIRNNHNYESRFGETQQHTSSNNGRVCMYVIA